MPDPLTALPPTHAELQRERAAYVAAFYTQPNDWPEDASHENGCYSNTCCECGVRFTGHKRRIVCRVCVQQKESERAS